MILDCFGLMHAADQRRALAERAARVAPGGVLLLQYHALGTIIRQRPVERAPARALRVLLDHRADRHAGGGRLQPAHGLAVRPLRRHRPAGRAAGRASGRPRAATRSVRSLLAEDARVGVRDPGAFAGLQRDVRAHAKDLHDWLAARAIRRDARWSATAPRPGRWRCCARRDVDRALLPRGDRRLARQAGPADAGNGHPGGRPGRAGRAPARTRCCCSSRTCWPRSGRHFPRSRPQAAGGWTLRGTGLTHACEQDAQPGQAAPAGGADAADRQPELVGDLGIGHRRVGHEHLEQPLPAPGQAGQRVADDLCALVGEQALVDLGLGHGRARSSSASSWLSTTLLRAARLRRHSFRAVAASQEPTRAGYSIRSMCSSSRSQVVWATSAASLSTSLNSPVIDQMSRAY